MLSLTNFILRPACENDYHLVKALAPRYDGLAYDIVKIEGVAYAVRLVFGNFKDASSYMAELSKLAIATV